MAESSFFGHTRGAFTGAHDNHRGYFEQADRGTLFLDEVGDLPQELPAKLLRTLETSRVTPLGATQERPVNVRIGGAEAVPNWSVQVSDFELAMSVTATVLSRGLTPADGDDLLAAYVVEENQPDGVGEIRGAASPVEISGENLYFLTVYASDTGEEIGLQFYDAERKRTYPVGTTLTFAANATFGDPASPLSLLSGFLTYSLDADNVVQVDIVDSNWTGIDTVLFAVQDQGTTKSLADTAQVFFTVEESLTIFGDVDGDEEVTEEDAQLILDHVVEATILTGPDATAADVSGDGQISPYDAGLVFRHTRGLISTFPAEQ